MAARRPNIATAGAELVFIVVALVAGLTSGTWAAFALVAGAALIYWVWSRRNALAAMSMGQRLAQGGFAIAVLLIILGGAFWVGLVLGGASI